MSSVFLLCKQFSFRLAFLLPILSQRGEEQIRNLVEIDGAVARIWMHSKLGEFCTLVDSNVIEQLELFGASWSPVFGKWGTYAEGGVPRHYFNIQLHRLLMSPPTGTLVDHINHDTLDNRLSNLRIVSHSLNTFNRRGPTSRNTSGFRGVHWCRYTSKWRAWCEYERKKYDLGRFQKIEDANAAITAFRATLV